MGRPLKLAPLTVALLGLAIREGLSFWTGHLDFEVWVRVGYYVSQGIDPYLKTSPITGLSTYGFGTLPTIGYPPIWALMQAGVYEIYRTIGIDNRFLYYFLLKQETIIPDVAAGYLIFYLLKRWGRDSQARNALTFWMLFPFLIIISAIWGMFDSLVLVFVLLAFVLMERPAMGAVSQAIGIVLKLIPVIFLPILAWYRNTVWSRLRYVLTATGIALLLAYLPYYFYPNWSPFLQLSTEVSTLNRITNSLNYAVVFYAQNSYYAVPKYELSALNLLGYLWIPSIAAAFVLCLRGIPRDSNETRYTIYSLEFVTLVFFLTRLSLPEEYVVYLLAFGLLAGRAGTRSFTGMWLSTLVYTVADNTYLTRFLAPIWSGAASLDHYLASGPLGEFRYGVMIVSAFAFTYFCVVYARTVYADIRKTRVPRTVAAREIQSPVSD